MPDEDIEQMIKSLVAGDVRTLSKAITLVESQLEKDQNKKLQLLQTIASIQSPAVKIGITGSPGVGKSTFLNGLISLFDESDNRIAILTIDPSSKQTGGSILGDKLRMRDLMAMKQVYIRSSPSKGMLGGINLTTRETVLLCEAAGYDYIFVETVGIGQSEIEVQNLVNEVWYLTMDRSGDEIQGIKRGILEVVDRVIVTKKDLDPRGAQKTMALLKQSMKTRITDDTEVSFYSLSPLVPDTLTSLFQDLKGIRARPLTSDQEAFWFDKGYQDTLVRFIKSDARLLKIYTDSLSQISKGRCEYWSILDKVKSELEELWKR